MLENIFGKRIIIEGGWSDDWYTFHLTAARRYIPDDATRINLLYALDLTYILKNGKLSQYMGAEKKTIDLGFNPLSANMERPVTLMIEDGRIYHDKRFLDDNIPANRNRLKTFVESILLFDREDAFNNLYKKCLREKNE